MARHRIVILAICLIGLITIWRYRLPESFILGGSSLAATTTTTTTPGSVTDHGIDLSDPEAPFISWPLARVCEESTTWTPGLVFVCDNNSGGIGNIRNYILTCLRYAIEAGAMGLVMPQIRTRSTTNLSNLMRDYKEFDYFFDKDHFRTSLTASCPQITIYDKTQDIPNVKEPVKTQQITPRNFGRRGGCDNRDLNRHTDLFGVSFQAWLSTTTTEFNLAPTSQFHPQVIRFNWGVQWDWPVFRDGPEFMASYGGLLRFRKDILDLGKLVTAAMRDFESVSGGGSQFNGPIGATGFVGFHLRSENDVLKGWPDFNDQVVAYLREASNRGFKAGYLATGNETESAKFIDVASSQHNIRVTTKHSLLQDHPSALKMFQALSWDQQAVIDYLVLLWSDYFLGVSPSSFSMTVAIKRHLQIDGLYTRPWKVGREGDGRSWLVGKYESYWDDWLFMYDSLWP